MKQLMIPTEGGVGELANVMEALGGLDVLDIDVQEEANHGFVVMRVEAYDEALKRLRAAGYKAITEDALVVRVKEEAGALAAVAKRFKEAAINVRSLHILRRTPEWVDVSLVTDDNVGASDVVKDLLVFNGE